MCGTVLRMGLSRRCTPKNCLSWTTPPHCRTPSKRRHPPGPPVEAGGAVRSPPIESKPTCSRANQFVSGTAYEFARGGCQPGEPKVMLWVVSVYPVTSEQGNRVLFALTAAKWLRNPPQKEENGAEQGRAIFFWPTCHPKELSPSRPSP